jgi:glucan-binding YG repeat protein
MGKSDVDVSCDSEGVGDCTVSSISNNSYGKKPKVIIKLKREDNDYAFKVSGVSLQKSDVTISGDDGTVSKVSCTASTATITVTLPKISSDSAALEIADVNWGDHDDGVVEWEQADDAEKYEVKLLRGSSTKENVTTTATSYNFRSAIRANGTGTYRVKIRAVAGTYKGDWYESDDFEVDSDMLSDLGGKSSGGSSYSGGGSSSASNPTGGGSDGGAWLRDTNGWWYCNANRSYTTNNWQQIDGYWFFFDERGYVKTGWLQSPSSGLWYYLSPDQEPIGHMVTNSYIGQYYVDASGVWRQ